jgi:hypothetical protein
VSARVIGFRLVDGLATLSMKKSVLDEEVIGFLCTDSTNLSTVVRIVSSITTRTHDRSASDGPAICLCPRVLIAYMVPRTVLRSFVAEMSYMHLLIRGMC